MRKYYDVAMDSTIEDVPKLIGEVDKILSSHS